jgi:hypothetical protein
VLRVERPQAFFEGGIIAGLDPVGRDFASVPKPYLRLESYVVALTYGGALAL